MPSKKGFTLIELLIVIAIIGILAAVVVLVLNPAQLLAQARDSRRVQDLDNLNTAIGTWLADVSTSSWAAVLNCTSGTAWPASGTCTTVTSRAVDSTGWVPINFNAMSTGAPISVLPLDPSNGSTSCSSGTTPNVCMYGWHSSATTGQYKLIANMESSKYQLNQAANDGGTISGWYEVGSNLTGL